MVACPLLLTSTTQVFVQISTGTNVAGRRCHTVFMTQIRSMLASLPPICLCAVEALFRQPITHT